MAKERFENERNRMKKGVVVGTPPARKFAYESIYPHRTMACKEKSSILL
jgi:hypothetical protein